MNLQQLIEKFFTPADLYRKQPAYHRASKHTLPSGIRATKRYADGRQMAAHNRRDMRKRK